MRSSRRRAKGNVTAASIANTGYAVIRGLCLHCLCASRGGAQDYRDVIIIENLECVRKDGGSAIACVAVPRGGAAYCHVLLLRAFIPYFNWARKVPLLDQSFAILKSRLGYFNHCQIKLVNHLTFFFWCCWPRMNQTDCFANIGHRFPVTKQRN